MIRSGSILSIFLIGLISWIKVITALSPLDALRSKHMKNKSFAYLQIIGVAQEYQGKGHGGKLMKEFITLAEEVSIPIYLETETASNVTFYKKYGFKTLEQIHLTGIYNPMWLMIRDSKNSS